MCSIPQPAWNLGLTARFLPPTSCLASRNFCTSAVLAVRFWDAFLFQMLQQSQSYSTYFLDWIDILKLFKPSKIGHLILWLESIDATFASQRWELRHEPEKMQVECKPPELCIGKNECIEAHRGILCLRLSWPIFFCQPVAGSSWG